MIVTIACPVALRHPEVNPDHAPIWLDAKGNEYRVASGLIEAEATEDPTPAPDRIAVIVGTDGLAALAAMGLVLPETGE